VTDAIALTLGAGFVLDLLLGDPAWLPHPVRLIGRLVAWGEPHCRRLTSNEYLAGALFVAAVVVAAGGSVWLILWLLWQVHPLLAILAMIYFMYAGIAVRDLAREATTVWRHLQARDLLGARRQLARIVGRDTEHLDAPGIVRASVETVAESTVDGILSPLFFAALGGAPGLWAYKAVNTLDSMIGHREEPYMRFGWAAARLDDVANFVPARLGLLLFGLGAWLTGGAAGRCWRIGWRDGGKHPSPNAGISEAAMAGALGVRLGGANSYDGIEEVRPYIGEALRPLESACIPQTVRIMYATSAAGLACCLMARWLVS
jgi:adenosylcobinamide-phosphate synthase